MDTSTFSIATIVETITSILTSVVSWFGDVLDFLVSNPLVMFGLLAPIAVAFVPKGIALVKKMIGKRRI